VTTLMNTGEDCWHECGSKEGPCSWCGTEGLCCRKGWTGNGCSGNMGGDDMHMCVKEEVAVNCQMGVWGDWSSCADSCPARDGTGNQTRTRTPYVYATNGGADCVEPTSENLACMYNCPVDCSWSSWTAWGSCSASCNGGTQGRYRNSTIEGSNGGAECTEEDDTELQTCNTNACPAAQYKLVESGRDCEHITSMTECETAARALGLADLTAVDDGFTSGTASDPPYCYNWISSGVHHLKFNPSGSNTGPCKTVDQCICKV